MLRSTFILSDGTLGTISTLLPFHLKSKKYLQQGSLVVPLIAVLAVDSDVIKMNGPADRALMFLTDAVGNAFPVEEMAALELNCGILLKADRAALLELLFEIAGFPPKLV